MQLVGCFYEQTACRADSNWLGQASLAAAAAVGTRELLLLYLTCCCSLCAAAVAAVQGSHGSSDG